MTSIKRRKSGLDTNEVPENKKQKRTLVWFSINFSTILLIIFSHFYNFLKTKITTVDRVRLKPNSQLHTSTNKQNFFFRRTLFPRLLNVQLNTILKIQVLICGLFVKNQLQLRKLKLEQMVRRNFTLHWIMGTSHPQILNTVNTVKPK